MIRALAPLAAALVCLAAALAVACGGGDDDADGTPEVTLTVTTGCTPARAVVLGDSSGTVTSGGLERSYFLRVPPGYDGTSETPMVLLLHGYSVSPDQVGLYSGFNDVADSNNAIVVYPVGEGEPPAWNSTGDVTRADDVQFLGDLLDKLEAELCIDASRIFVAGYSSGGALAQRLACESPDRIAAIATVASEYAECRADVPWVAIHGMADPVVPFEGGVTQAGRAMHPVRRLVSEWARELGCDGLAQITQPADMVELSTYVNCRLGTGEALLYSLPGGGHTWPGTQDLPVEAVGPTSKQLDGSVTIWEFFAAHTLAQ